MNMTFDMTLNMTLNMTSGVGGSDAQTQLAQLTDMTRGVQPILLSEYQQRIERASTKMQELGWDAMYIHAGTNLSYFTGTHWHPTERLVGALLTVGGQLQYIAPHFEIGTLQDFMQLEGEVKGWQEHESPYQLLSNSCRDLGVKTLGIDEFLPFKMFSDLQTAAPELTFVNGQQVSQFCQFCAKASVLGKWLSLSTKHIRWLAHPKGRSFVSSCLVKTRLILMG